jgi:hypothetical protein
MRDMHSNFKSLRVSSQSLLKEIFLSFILFYDNANKGYTPDKIEFMHAI